MVIWVRGANMRKEGHDGVRWRQSRCPEKREKDCGIWRMTLDVFGNTDPGTKVDRLKELLDIEDDASNPAFVGDGGEILASDEGASDKPLVGGASTAISGAQSEVLSQWLLAVSAAVPALDAIEISAT